LFLLPGCATIQGWRDAAILKAGYVNKAKLNTELSDLQHQMDLKLDAKAKEASDTKDAIRLSQDKREGAAANGFYGAHMGFLTIPVPNRTDLVIDNFVTEGWAALDNRMPDYQTMLDINARLKKELDEKQTSLDDLQKTHNQTLSDNQRLSAQTKILQDKLTSLQNDIANIKSDYGNQIAAKQKQISDNDDKIILLEKARGDDAKAIRAAKEKMSMILGGFALAALAGAIWSPVFKSKFGLFAGLLGFAAVAIWYITAWMVITVGGLGIAALVIWAVYEHSLEAKSAAATYSGLEDIKKTNPALWAQISPTLTQWQTKYVVQNGAVTTVPDPSISSHIDQTLMATNQK